MKDNWDKLDIFNRFLTGVVLGLIALVIKLGADKIAQSNQEVAQQMNRGEFVKQLITDLTSSDSKVRQDIGLIALDHYVGSTDSGIVMEIADDIFHDKLERDTVDQNLISTCAQALKIILKRDSAYGKQLQKELSDKLAQVQKNAGGDKSKVLSSNAAQIASKFFKKLVYIQYHDKENKSIVKSLQDSCNAKGWTAPGIDQVSSDFKNNIRYFHEDDAQFAANLKKYAESFLARRGIHATFDLQDMSNTNLQAPPGQVELWIE